MAKPKSKAEFGDFQTPLELAQAVCGKLSGTPATIVEPTCGVGNFLIAAGRQFGSASRLIGVELNGFYAEKARNALRDMGRTGSTVLHHDFFSLDWKTLLSGAELPLLVVGNPPWVTNSELGSLGSSNLPTKANSNLKGLDALTGRSNFDISEWMGVHLLELLKGVDATIALLVKVSVARKLLQHAWTSDLSIHNPRIFRINAMKHFGASVDACLFVCRTDRSGERRCPVYADLQGEKLEGAVGIDEKGALIADIDAMRRTAHLAGADGGLEWRSGVKHDCSKVFELRKTGGGFVNGFGESVQVEPEVLYPLMKSSDVAKARFNTQRWLVVPQKVIGENTHHLQMTAPLAWAYLKRHEGLLNGRKSRIYKNRPPFSIFGVGEYTFTNWKIAISGLYKKLEFTLVPPVDGRPVVFDDTVYVTPCKSEADARRKLAVLSSPVVRDFYSSFIFWDAKRPITAKVLRQLNFQALAPVEGFEPPTTSLTAKRSTN